MKRTPAMFNKNAKNAGIKNPIPKPINNFSIKFNSFLFLKIAKDKIAPGRKEVKKIQNKRENKLNEIII
ncbi:MAG: hypothetical protein AABX38_03915 [Candidatus Micrarchaeota archaeon]